MADDDSNPSRFEKYCERFNINPNLVMLKVTLFMMYGGKININVFLVDSISSSTKFKV